MHTGAIIWKIFIIFFSIATLITYISGPSRQYNARFNAFRNCAIYTETAICAQLFGD